MVVVVAVVVDEIERERISPLEGPTDEEVAAKGSILIIIPRGII